MPAIAAAAGSAIAGIAGSWLGGRAQRDAAREAAETQQRTTDANNALARWGYGQNAARLDPIALGGFRAGNVLQNQLFGGGYVGGGAPAGGGNALAGVGGAAGGGGGGPTAQQQIDYLLSGQGNPIGPKRMRQIQMFQGTPDQKLAMIQGLLHDNERAAYNNWMLGQEASSADPYGLASGGEGPVGEGGGSALDPWDVFRNSTNYQFRLGEGQRALNTGYAGTNLDSGAARLALAEHGQNFAANELSNWQNMMAQQQQIGANAAANMAGQTNQMTSSTMQNNQMGADAAANSALIGGNARAGTWGAIGQGVGQVAGAFGSSYGNSGGGGGGAGNYATQSYDPLFDTVGSTPRWSNSGTYNPTGSGIW
jgi:hypothetical protein